MHSSQSSNATKNNREVTNCDPLSLEIHQNFPMNQEAWDELVEATNAGIYLTYDWCQSWWEQYGLNRELRIFLIYETNGDHLVGVLPMFIDHIRVGLKKINLAKMLGSDFTIGTCEIPVLSEWMSQAVQSVITELTVNDHCDAVLLGPSVSLETQSLVGRGIGQMGNAVKSIACPSKRPHSIFECPETFDEYLKSLSKSTRKSCNNWWNRLCKNYDISEDVVVVPSGEENSFAEFMEMHAAQWQGEGKLGHFGDWPFADKFHSDLACRQANRNRFFLLRILDEDKVISYQYVYACGNILHWMLPARIVDSELDRLSLGRVSLVRLMNWAINEGYSYIDAGAGHYPYKLQLGAKEYERQFFLIVKNKLGSQWRLFAFRLQGKLLNFLYYKLWFARVAPKLNIQRPLWKSWIRRQLT